MICTPLTASKDSVPRNLKFYSLFFLIIIILFVVQCFFLFLLSISLLISLLIFVAEFVLDVMASIEWSPRAIIRSDIRRLVLQLIFHETVQWTIQISQIKPLKNLKFGLNPRYCKYQLKTCLSLTGTVSFFIFLLF